MNNYSFLVFLLCIPCFGNAQKIEYSRKNIFIDNPDELLFVSNISGNHHFLKFFEKENPEIFVFNSELQLEKKVSLPFKFPERCSVSTISLKDFYYICLHQSFSSKYLFYKIDKNGKATDLSVSFQKLLQSQSDNVKLGFQLVPDQNELCMVYHTAITDLEKNTVVLVKTDSLLNIIFSHKVAYNFKREEETLQQEILMMDRYLLILKTSHSNTSLEVMKVNLATGYSISNTFSSSGYFYSQPSFSYNKTDSTITVTALLTEPKTFSPKKVVFVSRLNKILIEQIPFAVLKTQFSKNATINFLLADNSSKWVRLITERQSSPAIRFSLLDKNFKIISERYVHNNKDSYTLLPDQFVHFTAGNKQYILVAQRFFKRNNGFLLVSSDEDHLTYSDVRVFDHYKYEVTKAQQIPNGVIIPYTYRREAGFVKITIE